MSSPTVNVPLPDRSDAVGDVISIDLRDYLNDADSGDSLTFSASGIPGGSGLSFNPSTGILSGTPTAADAAASPITVTVTATDDGGNEQTITLNLTVESITPPADGFPTPPTSRGLYLIWYGNDNPELDKPYIKGGQVYSQLSNVYDNADFTDANYSTVTPDLTALDSATGGPKPFTLQLNPQKDNSMKQLVWYLHQAKAVFGEAKVELDGDWIPASWDEAGDGVALMNACWDAAVSLYAVALSAAQQARCIGIRHSAGFIAVESIAPSTAAGQESDNYTQGSLANAVRPADFSTGLRDAALETHYQYVIDLAFPNGTDEDAVLPIFLRPEIGNLSVGLNNQFDEAWNNNRMGIFVTNWTEEPYNNHSRDQAVKFYDVCRTNGNLKGLAEAHDENPGSHNTLNGANYSALQRKWWGVLCCLHMGATWIYMRPEYTSLYGTGSENQREWKEIIDFVNRYAGWHLDPGNAPGAWLALREGNRFTSSDAGGGNYQHHMTQITTGDGDRGTELYAGNGLFPSSDYVGRPSSTSQNTTNAGTGQRQSIWAFLFAASENLKLALDSTFATSIDSGDITVFVHYLDVGTAGFTVEVFGVTVDTITCTNTMDWIVAAYPLTSVTVAVDVDGAHLVFNPNGDVRIGVVEVRRG